MVKNEKHSSNGLPVCKELIAEGLEKGYVNPDSSIEIIYEPDGFRKELKIVLSDKPRSIGSITSAYPGREV